MAKKPKKEVATTGSGGAVSVPSYMEGKGGKGVEAIGTGDIETPRIALLQSTSDEVQDGDFKMGEFFHNIAEESLGDTVSIVPIFVDIRYILWRPRHEGGGILARADDGVNWQPKSGSVEVAPFKDMPKKKVTWAWDGTVQQSGLDQWGSTDPDDEDSPPAATKMYNIVCVLPDFPAHSPCVITLQRAAITIARKFVGKLKMSEAPSYGMKFNMSSFVDQNAGGDEFRQYKFTGDGFVDEEMFVHCEALYERFVREGLHIKDVEGAQEDDAPGNPAAGGPDPDY